MKRLLVLGAGTAGTMVVNKLRRRLGRDLPAGGGDQAACATHHRRRGPGRRRGIRDRVALTYATPLPGAFTKPVASARLPGKPAKKMAYIAGLPKPHGCV